MSTHTDSHAAHPSTVGDYVRHGNYRLAAQQMVSHLGTMAAACAIDRQAQARITQNPTETSFWSHVCREIIAMQTATRTVTH